VVRWNLQGQIVAHLTGNIPPDLEYTEASHIIYWSAVLIQT